MVGKSGNHLVQQNSERVLEQNVIKKHWKTDWFIGLVVTLLILLSTSTELMDELEWHAYDLGVRFSSTDPANSDVVIVAIDAAALQELGAWPWPRDLMAKANKIITASRPSVIGYAVPFDSGQSTYGLEYVLELKELVEKKKKLATRKVRRLLNQAEISMDPDQKFATSLRLAGRVVLAMPYLTETGRSSADNSQLSPYLEKYLLKDVAGIPDATGLFSGFTPDPVAVADALYPPIESLAKYSGGAGVINLGYGGARRARTEPLVMRYGENYLPSFSLMMLVRNKQLSANSIKVDLGKSVKLDDHQFTTDSKLQIYPHFYRGRKGASPFKVYPILDVINGEVEKSAFRDKKVLVGLTAPQHVNPMITPIDEAMAPVMVTAHTVSSLLNDELYAVPDWSGWVRYLTFAAIALYLMFVLPRFRLGTGLAITALSAIIMLNIHFFFMLSESTWIKLMGPLVALLAGHLVYSSKHFLGHHLQGIYSELSSANQALAQSYHSQGQLDLAFERYRKCDVDNSLLNHLYNLGLDYERKRQFNKAITVFKYIAGQQSDYNDVQDRLARNQEVANAMVLGSSNSGNGAPSGTLVISSTGIQKPMLGRFQIDKELGRGAMGMVYQGHDAKIGRTVAIKTMSLAQEFEGEKLSEVKARFFREAETAGRLNHPNIVTIYDVGEDQELSYIAMDYLKGKDLMAWSKFEDLLPATEVFDVIIKVAEAMDYAHRQHVVHRDVKPANIIYDQNTGSVKVTDFGVACLTDASKTKTGTILGSPSYMSPEQLAGQKVDGRSDIFSLGVTLYQLLSGELPFIADSLASLMYKIANEKHPNISMFRPELPGCVSQIVNKALRKKVEDRFQSGEQMANALKRCRDRMETKTKTKTGKSK